MLDTLNEFLDRISAIADRAEGYFQSESPIWTEELALARAEQSRILASYQLFVHRECFAPIMQTGSPADIRAAIGLKAECIALVEDFRSFRRECMAKGVADRWAEYRLEAIDFTARVRTHVANVRRDAADYLHGRPASPACRAIPPNPVVGVLEPARPLY